MFRNSLLKFLGVVIIAGAFWFVHQICTPKTTQASSPSSDSLKSKLIAKLTGTAAPKAVVATKKTEPAKPAPAKVAPTPGDVCRGMALQINYTVDGVDRYLKMIDEIADLGANTVGLSTAGYQEHAGSGWISLDHRYSPNKEQFAKLIKRAHERGLKVELMPVLLLKNPRGTEWRGVIQPTDWDQWFSSYLSFIKFFAEVGLENNVEYLAIGAELVSTESMRERWIKVIEEVRKTYHGKLFYSANWDHYKQVTFWDKLDVVGMTTYHKLSDVENPTLADLIKAWAPIRQEIQTWQATINRPILFTEVGWCSQPGCSIEAWNYYRRQEATEAGEKEQATCYRSFIEAWRGQPGVLGAMWWEWTEGTGGASDFGYTPKGKLAEEVLRQWYRDTSWSPTTTQPATTPTKK